MAALLAGAASCIARGVHRRMSPTTVESLETFIVDLPTKPRNAAIVKAAIHLTHELGLLVVVEGVETAEELAMVQSWGCRLIQGFYYSKPLPAAGMTTLLRVGTIVPDLPAVVGPAAA